MNGNDYPQLAPFRPGNAFPLITHLHICVNKYISKKTIFSWPQSTIAVNVKGKQACRVKISKERKKGELLFLLFIQLQHQISKYHN